MKLMILFISSILRIFICVISEREKKNFLQIILILLLFNTLEFIRLKLFNEATMHEKINKFLLIFFD